MFYVSSKHIIIFAKVIEAGWHFQTFPAGWGPLRVHNSAYEPTYIDQIIQHCICPYEEHISLCPPMRRQDILLLHIDNIITRDIILFPCIL